LKERFKVANNGVGYDPPKVEVRVRVRDKVRFRDKIRVRFRLRDGDRDGYRDRIGLLHSNAYRNPIRHLRKSQQRQ
jgi:hypothetical protein